METATLKRLYELNEYQLIPFTSPETRIDQLGESRINHSAQSEGSPAGHPGLHLYKALVM